MTLDEINQLPDGFYLLSNPKELRKSLVRLYICPDFNGVRNIGFGVWDGAGFIPVTDLSQESILTPVVITSTVSKTTDNIDILPSIKELLVKTEAALSASDGDFIY